MIQKALNGILMGLMAMALLFLPAFPSQAQQRIAAIVGPDIISSTDLKERVSLALLFGGFENNAQNRQRFLPQVFRQLVDDVLKLQEAKRLGVNVTRQEVDREVSRISQPNGYTVEEFINILNQNGVRERTLREQIRSEIAWIKLIRREIAPSVAVNKTQIDMAIETEQRTGSDEFLLSEILLPVYSAETENSVRNQALELRAAIREGAEFSSMASQVSIASSASSGGDLGWLAIERLSPLLKPVVEGLRPGQISDPVRTPAGFQLILVRDRRKAQTLADDPNARQLSQALVPIPDEVSTQQAETVRQQLLALRGNMRGCRDVETLAVRRQLPSSGNLGWILLEQMPVELQEGVRQLTIGEISQPIRSAAGFHLIAVCAIGGGENSQEKREAIRENLEREQIELLARRYLRDLRQETFIDQRVTF